jgi:uncharacterized membrane protein (UPF0127 family)
MSQKIRTGLLIFFCIIGIFSAVFLRYPPGKTEMKNTAITFKNVVVNVDVADTEALRAKGLSGRVSLPDGTGMWFAYRENGIYSFWMPDMHFPIDIIWFDENFQVVSMQQNVTPESYPRVFTPDVPARYVLEVPSGFVQKNGIIIGDEASVQNTP